MKLSELKEGSKFIFEEDGRTQPHEVISQKGEMTFCKTPSGLRQYYDSNNSVLFWQECLKCMPGMPCPFCDGFGFITSTKSREG